MNTESKENGSSHIFLKHFSLSQIGIDKKNTMRDGGRGTKKISSSYLNCAAKQNEELKLNPISVQ